MNLQHVKNNSLFLLFGAFLGLQSAFADFNGMLALNNCSGSLVRFPGSLGSDKAMALTNGHCLGFMPRPGKVVYDVKDERGFSVLNAQGDGVGKIYAERILYATMTRTDIALYRLERTYDEIEAIYSVRPYTLSPRAPEVGLSFNMISSYWRTSQACQVEAIIPTLKEARWTFHDSIRYDSSCNSRPGSSGSALVIEATREIIGINNTSNNGRNDCSLDNPCEFDEKTQMPSSIPGRGYGQQTQLIVDCLNSSNQFDFDKPDCKLPRPQTN